MSSSWKKYLLYFAHEHVDFRFAEIKSLLGLFKISMRFIEQPTPLQPYWIVQFRAEEDVKLLASRSVSLRFCIELWAHAKTFEDLHQNLKTLPNNTFESHLQPHKTFKIDVQSFCKHLSQSEKLKKIQVPATVFKCVGLFIHVMSSDQAIALLPETFGYLPFKGEVKLDQPDIQLQYLEYYGINSNNPPAQPYCVFFGRWVTSGFRQLIRQLSLKTRKFIGNTSMDPQLSLLMANQAQVKSGDLVLDPFVGSGSLLVAAAHFGGFVMGTDIDFLMLHGKTRPSRIKQKKREEDESIKANMEQYGLLDKYVDVLINDFATPFWRDNLKFDSIITDPPYGIREATEKVGIHRENYSISEEHLPTHIPAKVEYAFAQLYLDLLAFAAKQLKLGGRLVCWFPVFREDYTEEGLPVHPSLKLIANSEQVLSKYTSRRLLTYEKVTQPTALENGKASAIADFKNKYFRVRNETRHERRTRQAAVREQNRLEALQRLEKLE